MSELAADIVLVNHLAQLIIKCVNIGKTDWILYSQSIQQLASFTFTQSAYCFWIAKQADAADLDLRQER